MAYKNKLPMKEDRMHMIQDYLEISAFRKIYRRTFTPSWQTVI